MKNNLKDLWALVAGGTVLAVASLGWAGFKILGREKMAKAVINDAIDYACTFGRY